MQGLILCSRSSSMIPGNLDALPFGSNVRRFIRWMDLFRMGLHLHQLSFSSKLEMIRSSEANAEENKLAVDSGISTIRSQKHGGCCFLNSWSRDKSERIWIVEARSDLDHCSGPIDLMRENLRHSGFESLEHGGGCLPKSWNHKMWNAKVDLDNWC